MRLGAVDVGPGRAVDDRVGRGVAHGGADGVGVGDVEVAAGEGDDVVAGALGGGDDVRPSMPAAPVTRRRMARILAQSRLSGAQGQRELEARLGVLEPVAEQLAQLA